MRFDRERALALLRAGTGVLDAQFREGQEEAIRHVVEGRGRLLLVQRTGWGKSFVYFIAARLLREQGMGPALLVSPLLALMNNQLLMAGRMGVRAEKITSDNKEDWGRVEAQLEEDHVDILLVSPERLANERFRENVLARVGNRVPLLVVDEAHCISDWGHDFRPHYRLIGRLLRTLPGNVRLLATTATANRRVTEDIRAILGSDLKVMRGPLARPSLALQVLNLPDRASRLAWLARHVPDLPGSGIIYTLTVRDAELVARWLRQRGLEVEAYTGRTGEVRADLEQALLANRVKALVATSALGMGFDKPDLGFVIHFQCPGSVVTYYQQVGRAGRRLARAHGILLAGEEDFEIVDYFIRSAFPRPDHVEAILRKLDEAEDGLTRPQLLAAVNLPQKALDQALLLLSLEAPAPVVKEGDRWRRTPATLSPEFWERIERITALREREKRQMREYLALEEGHMDFLVAALDGTPGRGSPPPAAPLPATVPGSLLRDAQEFLRRLHRPIEPRINWPTGGLPRYGCTGRIPAAERPAGGYALCHWEDPGWGEMVRRGKYADGRFPDELVGACVDLVREWNPVPAPAWVTCIPSLRHPDLVPGFARRLAAALGLPFLPVLRWIAKRPEQKLMANSVQQARNLDGALEVGDDVRVPAGPVLLVDDVVDSRWTFTIASWLLRRRGSGEVWLLALATASRA